MLKELIESDYINEDLCFSLLKYSSSLMSSGEDEDLIEARKIAIHILNKWENIDENSRLIWKDIIEGLGFYPYIKRNSDLLIENDFANEIRIQSHESQFLNGVYFHKGQKILSNLLTTEKNVVASAPTSFGKSLLIEEIIASKNYKNIVIIQPTLALLDETRTKLLKYRDGYKIIVRTTQEPSTELGNIFLLTAERVMEYDFFYSVDFLIIDEFYKLSLRRKDNRADTLNNAFLKIYNQFNCRFYMLGPNIDNITAGFSEKYNAHFYKSHFSLVDCEVFNMYEQMNITNLTGKERNEKQKKSILFDLLYSLIEEQTLIYCSSPARARRLAFEFEQYLEEKGIRNDYEISAIKWIENNISDKWSYIDCLKRGISFHDGSLQKHLATTIIEYFNSGKLKYIFCTSTIIEGVNTSAKNVVLFDNRKGQESLDYFDYSNIKGRSGRMMEHYVGRIYNFIEPPSREDIIIDIPFFEQNPSLITDEILINIPTHNLNEDLRDRYDEINKLPFDLLTILKKNGVSINGQLAILHTLERNINLPNYYNFAWNQTPNHEKLVYTLNLAYMNLFDFEGSTAVRSVEQLAVFISKYRSRRGIMEIVENQYNWHAQHVKNLTPDREKKYYDEAIEKAFHIYRHWFQYTVPKALRVVDSLQRYVCSKHNKHPGSYSYFVQQLENEFIRDNLTILNEYGIPTSTIKYLEKFIPSELNEDEVIKFMGKNYESLSRNLLPYEKEKLIKLI